MRKCRDVTAGANGATAVAPNFSDTLTLFQPGGGDSAPTLQRLHQKFPHDYISDISKLKKFSLLTALTAPTAQTVTFMFSNVASDQLYLKLGSETVQSKEIDKPVKKKYYLPFKHGRVLTWFIGILLPKLF